MAGLTIEEEYAGLLQAATNYRKRAIAAEAERDELKAECDEQADRRISAEADRSRLALELEQAQREIDYLRRNMDLARKQVSEWNAETPLGQALDGLGDEVES